DDIQSRALQMEAFGEVLARLTKGRGIIGQGTAGQEAVGQFDLNDYLVLRETWSEFSIRKNVFDAYAQLRQLGLRRFEEVFAAGGQLSPDDLQARLKPLELSVNWPHRLLVDDQSDGLGQASPSTLLLRLTAAFAESYDRLSFEQSSLDYNEQLLWTRELLNNPQVLQELQSQFRFTMVDEAQDTNALQMEIITKIAASNLYQVGDMKQSIYGFQGANVGVMQAYQDSLQDPESIFELRDNYRSDAGVLNFANVLFGTEELLGYPAPKLRAHKQAPEGCAFSRGVHVLAIASDGEGAKVDKKRNAEEEAQWIADQFQAEADKGRSWSDFVVLVEKRAQATALLDEFTQRGMPALLQGGRSLLDVDIVKDALLFLEMLTKPRDPELLLKLLLSPLGRVSDQGIYELAKLRREQSFDYLWATVLLLVDKDSGYALSDDQDQEALCGLVQTITKGRASLGMRPLSEVVNRAFSERELDLHYLSQGALAGRQAHANLQKFLRHADSWQATGKNPFSFVEEIKQQKGLGLVIQQEAVSLPGEECITIDTIHSSKGREYPVVALPLATSLKMRINKESLAIHQLTEELSLSEEHVGEKDSAPDVSCETVLKAGDCIMVRRDSKTKPAYESRHYEELHQESRMRKQFEAHRLLYVACTRAEDKLFISYSKTKGGDALSAAMQKGIEAASEDLQQLQEVGALKLEEIDVSE
ncbi:MAG: ATP-dependent helicase, partial [Coriobacteriia bacterium]|nr:ATP-dependent helicase [Coriobacteriia bacterium]